MDSNGVEELNRRLDGLNLAVDGDGGIVLRGQVIADRDLSGLDLSGMDLSGADLSGSDLSSSSFVGANLEDAKLCGAKLHGAEFLDACLHNADLSEAEGGNVGFARADLRDIYAVGARLKNGSWSEACLERANFGGAVLKGGRFRGANLAGGQFVRTNLRRCDLAEAKIDHANFNRADLSGGGMSGVRGYETANWIGTNVLGVDFHGAYLVRRHLMDENYLHEFRRRGRFSRFLYWVWWVTSDCGRSLLRWTAWVAALMVGYAIAYLFVDIDFGPHETALSPLYFSIVTVTTLGYGDAVPASLPAQLLTVSEAIFGYIGLGGLLSIFSQKMARRAD